LIACISFLSVYVFSSLQSMQGRTPYCLARWLLRTANVDHLSIRKLQNTYNSFATNYCDGNYSLQAKLEEKVGGDGFTSAELGGVSSDVVISFTYHAIQRLQERFGVAFAELKNLLHNFFNFESFSASGKRNWRMLIPLRYCLVGTFEGNCFVVKTVFFNIMENMKRGTREVRRLRVADISCPPIIGTVNAPRLGTR